MMEDSDSPARGSMFRRISTELDRQYPAPTTRRTPIVVGPPNCYRRLDLAIDLACAFGAFLVFALLLVAVCWEWM